MASTIDDLPHAFLFALETGMRQGEIVALTWSNVFLEKRFLKIQASKNGDKRTVPLSNKAIELLKLQPHREKEARCFPIKSSSADTQWRKARKKAQVVDLCFHDTRHEAVTRLSKKLDVLELARTIGHRDLKSLMIYYNPTAEELAERLG